MGLWQRLSAGLLKSGFPLQVPEKVHVFLTLFHKTLDYLNFIGWIFWYFSLQLSAAYDFVRSIQSSVTLIWFTYTSFKCSTVEEWRQNHLWFNFFSSPEKRRLWRLHWSGAKRRGTSPQAIASLFVKICVLSFTYLFSELSFLLRPGRCSALLSRPTVSASRLCLLPDQSVSCVAWPVSWFYKQIVQPCRPPAAPFFGPATPPAALFLVFYMSCCDWLCPICPIRGNFSKQSSAACSQSWLCMSNHLLPHSGG